MSSTTWQSSLTMPVAPGRDHVCGRIDAPATMVEYGDYECPFCRMAFAVVKEIVDELGDHLLFVYHQFPLSTVHPHAQAAAEAEAAGAQGQFWDMHRLLYADQRHLGGAALVDRAQALGLDVDRIVVSRSVGRAARRSDRGQHGPSQAARRPVAHDRGDPERIPRSWSNAVGGGRDPLLRRSASLRFAAEAGSRI